MKRTKRTLLALLLCACMLLPMFSTAASAADITTSNIALAEEYLELFIQSGDNVVVDAQYCADLRSSVDNQPFAYLFTLGNDGYAIVGMESFQVFEYAFEGGNPYAGYAQPYYYDALLEHHVIIDGRYTSIETGLSVPVENGSFSAFTVSAEAQNLLKEYDEETEMTSVQKADAVSSLHADVRTGDARSSTSGSLTGALSTVSHSGGWCGPNAAFVTLQYRGYVQNSGVYIVRLADYVCRQVPTNDSAPALVSTMQVGMNEYLLEHHNIGYAFSFQGYTWSRVTSSINANLPVILETDGGGITTGWHFQTIHEYYSSTGSNGTTTYRLFVNSWGQNGQMITYRDSVPSYIDRIIFYNF